eukprot:1158981-Pelagomonas_calceolata.AAC.13
MLPPAWVYYCQGDASTCLGLLLLMLPAHHSACPLEGLQSQYNPCNTVLSACFQKLMPPPPLHTGVVHGQAGPHNSQHGAGNGLAASSGGAPGLQPGNSYSHGTTLHGGSVQEAGSYGPPFLSSAHQQYLHDQVGLDVS